MSEWTLCQYSQIEHIEKFFYFKKYSRVIAFANTIAGLAEAHTHHPRMVIEWGKITIAWGTHESLQGSGVLSLDRALAKKTDELYASLTSLVD